MADNLEFPQESQQNAEERRQIRIKYRNLIDDLQGLIYNVLWITLLLLISLTFCQNRSS